MPMTPEARRVAVLGGTFDPVHLAHLALATGTRDAIGAREAWLVPARTPALRGDPVAPPHLRLAMLETAVRAIDDLRVVDVELRRAGTSYTIDTLEALRVSHPADEPWWVVGADAARHIHEWHRSEELLAVLRLVVVQRAGSPHLDDAEARGLGLDRERTIVLDLTPPAISASEVRRRVARGEPITTLVPRAVADIISASGLYRTAAVR
ncbi:MAG TPA: nicotinate (nicotinamide) nucleotide adenylyltransferase [Candidatus Deferrimicrobium sp.]|nr:nicotinate (nicotinamide) nucleotide adenylyltransferase [Candidatus Deferrimicrobium sp.]